MEQRVNTHHPPPYDLDRTNLEKMTRIETFRATGPGGQHVNKTSSAVRLTHLPSGTIVIARDSPSQLRNREIAFSRLIEKLKILNHVPKRRLATHPTRASRIRRMEEKKLRGRIKTFRRSLD